MAFALSARDAQTADLPEIAKVEFKVDLPASYLTHLPIGRTFRSKTNNSRVEYAPHKRAKGGDLTSRNHKAVYSRKMRQEFISFVHTNPSSP